jgi:hypothetical protein
VAESSVWRFAALYACAPTAVFSLWRALCVVGRVLRCVDNPQWVALVDDLDEKDEGIQGYLRLSVAVVGPGDKLKIHDPSEKESMTGGIDRGASGGKDATSASALQLLIPPTVKQDLRFLVVTLHKVACARSRSPLMAATLAWQVLCRAWGVMLSVLWCEPVVASVPLL